MSFKFLPAALLVGLATFTQAASADDAPDTIKALQQRIEELDQKVRILERKDELEKDAAIEQSKSAPRLSIDAGGFSASSADTNFVLKLRGGFQADARFYPGNETPAKDTFLFRRVRPIVEGTVYG